MPGALLEASASSLATGELRSDQAMLKRAQIGWTRSSDLPASAAMTAAAAAAARSPAPLRSPWRRPAAMGLLSIIRKTKLKEHEMRLLLV